MRNLVGNRHLIREDHYSIFSTLSWQTLGAFEWNELFVLPGHNEFEGFPKGSRSGKHLTGRPPDDEGQSYDAETPICVRRPKHSNKDSTLCVLSIELFQPRHQLEPNSRQQGEHTKDAVYIDSERRFQELEKACHSQ